MVSRLDAVFADLPERLTVEELATRLEPLLRDTVVLNLPPAPVCSDDCRGLCVGCGQRLDDLPADHTHEVVDPRWAGLAQKFTSSSGAPDESPTTEEN